jgi:hypothetical protein
MDKSETFRATYRTRERTKWTTRPDERADGSCTWTTCGPIAASANDADAVTGEATAVVIWSGALRKRQARILVSPSFQLRIRTCCGTLVHIRDGCLVPAVARFFGKC